MFSFKRSLIALVGLLVLVGALATLMPLVSRGQGGNPIVKQLQQRRFYLTQTTPNGSQALTACAVGYHMAALYEILDPSNFKYDTQLGLIRDDSGSGPPTNVTGWIRTGSAANGSGQPGFGNCNAWTSASLTDSGTAVALSIDFDSVQVISPWVAVTPTCSSAGIRVWCAQD
jgi:hypothetical protein